MQNFKEQYWFLSTIILGMVSGIISFIIYVAYIMQAGNIGIFTSILYYLPGLFFGLFSLFHFILFSRRQVKILGSFIWLISSTLSFNTAFYISSNFFDTRLPIMGLIGLVILILPFHFFICKLKLVNVLLLLVIAGLSGFTGSWSFFVWQTLILSTFGYFIYEEYIKYLYKKR